MENDTTGKSDSPEPKPRMRELLQRERSFHDRWAESIDVDGIRVRKVVDVLNALPRRARYLRGLRAWIGFCQTAVPFQREPRFAGEVKSTFRKSFSLAATGRTRAGS